MAKNKKSYLKVFLFYLAERAVRSKGAGVIPPLLTEVKSRELLAFPTDRPTEMGCDLPVRINSSAIGS